MFYFLIFIIVLLLWLFIGTSSKSKGCQYKAPEIQSTQPVRYLKTRQEAKDEYRKRAIETYTKMGLADLLPRMIIEEGADGEFQIRWAGLDKEQEERILKASYESDDTELVGIEDKAKLNLNVHIHHVDKADVHGNNLGHIHIGPNSTYIENQTIKQD